MKRDSGQKAIWMEDSMTESAKIQLPIADIDLYWSQYLDGFNL
jgi:hypothetical protein